MVSDSVTVVLRDSHHKLLAVLGCGGLTAGEGLLRKRRSTFSNY